MSVTPEDVARLFRVRKTIMQMLVDRDYIVVKEDMEQSLEQFKASFGLNSNIRDELTMLVPYKSDPSMKMMVFFGGIKLGVDHMRTYTGRMEAENATRAIIVAESAPTPRFGELINQVNGEGKFHFQVFSDKELLVNITEHVLVPEHVPLTPDQVKELLKRYKLKLSQLPRIQTSDPIARYYGLVKGQVVKIVRKSETAGRYVTYRTAV